MLRCLDDVVVLTSISREDRMTHSSDINVTRSHQIRDSVYKGM